MVICLGTERVYAKPAIISITSNLMWDKEIAYWRRPQKVALSASNLKTIIKVMQNMHDNNRKYGDEPLSPKYHPVLLWHVTDSRNMFY